MGAGWVTRLILPLPPSKNAAYNQANIGGRLRRLPSAATQRFNRDARVLAQNWAQNVSWTQPDAGEKVVMRFWIWWPDRRKRDPANMIDGLADALKGVLFPDDDILLPQAMDFAIDRENPRLEVELEVKAEVNAHG